jgi:hypothetical protein
MSLLTAVVEALRDEGLSVDVSEAPPAARVGVLGEHGRWLVYARVVLEDRVLVFYGHCPVVAPPERRPEMMELLTRVNLQLALGSFDLDLADGQIRVRTSLDLEGTAPEPNLLRRLFYANVAAMDVYLPAITAVATEGRDPERALLELRTP